MSGLLLISVIERSHLVILCLEIQLELLQGVQREVDAEDWNAKMAANADD